MSSWHQLAHKRRSRLLMGALLALTFFDVASCFASPPQLLTPSALKAATADDGPAGARAECLRVLGVDRWHRAGFRGQGCTIAILDSGFRDYRDFLGTTLPARVVAKSFRRDGNLEARDSQHGILCGEVIHAIAPDAELLLANWEPDDPNAFLQAVRWAKGQGARILTCSLIMPSWSDGEGGGQVHEALAQLLGSGQTARDLVFFASAGNTALRHWSGTFCPNEGGLHQWGAGRTTNLLKPWASERVAVELYGPTKVSCELQVWEEATGNLVGNMILQPDGAGLWGQAVVRFEPLPGRDYRVRLRCPAAIQGKEKFHVVALGGDLEEVSPGGSIAFPGDGVQVVAVGAVDRAGKRLSYSSCGPNSSRPKPDFVSAVPFPSFFRTRPFAGTSAAAPQAAALAALCYARNPEWTPNQLHAALESAALDLCTPGHDCETGYGLIRLP